MGNIIFFGGIHGVGKTYLAETLQAKLDIPRYLASELISSKRKIDYRIDKKVDDIGLNQNLLFEALRERNLFRDLIILEGHFCLINKKGGVERIPKEVFSELNIKVIVLIYEEPIEIIKRINKRGTKEYDLNFIDRFQKDEIDYAKEISEYLDLPLFISNSSEFNISLIRNLIK